MNIVITNAVTLNGGDAAILQGVMRTLKERWPTASFDVFDSQADVARELYPDVRYHTLVHATLPGGRARRWHARRLLLAARLFRQGARRAAQLLCSREELNSIATIAEADLVVSTGGTYLVEVYDIRHRIFELRLAAACGQHVVFFTQSLGPFHKRQSQIGLRPAFDAAPVVLLRDQRSLEHLRALGVSRAKLSVVPDAAFALADRRRLDEAMRRTYSAPLRVAISVRRWTHFRDVSAEEGMDRFQRAMAGLTTHLVHNWQARVLFVSTCQGIPEYWAKDSETAEAIVSLLDADVAEHVTVDSSFHRPTELCAVLGEHDVVVATRMHAGILALCAGTPVLPIAYEFKTEELFESLGMGELVSHIDDASANDLAARFDALMEALPTHQHDWFAKVGALREAALHVARLLPRPSKLAPIAHAVRRQKLTYLSDQKLYNIQHCLDDLMVDGIEGDCIEAGVALGGSAIVICALMGKQRRFVGYDVFAMIPPPGERDDDKSHARYATIESGASAGIGGDDYYGYRDDLLQDVVTAFEQNGLAVDGQRIALQRGLFEDTMQLEDRRIAFAHIDCDWYEPVKLCLERIYAVLVPGGFIVSDDYHDYGGCREAVDAFIASHDDIHVVSRKGNLVMRRQR